MRGNTNVDLLIIGGGPAGLSAALKAQELGIERILLVDERSFLGGILPQCIHPGFGLHILGRDLTGCELAELLSEKLSRTPVEVINDAYVAELSIKAYDNKEAIIVSPKGVLRVQATAVIYAAGCRERHMFDIGLVGDRPAGIYTAGEAQAMMDLYGILPGEEIVIIGSGDVGLIMARRFALEGAKVKAVVEIMPYPGGLLRNVVQCLMDFDIPLLLSHKALMVKGKKRVSSVIIAKVDQNLNPVPGTETEIKCDTVIIAAGLKPRVRLLKRAGALIDPSTGGPVVNEWLETTLPGVFAAGNCLIVNDLVDYAMEQGEWAAESAARFIREGGLPAARWKRIIKGNNIRAVVPHLVGGFRPIILYSRALRPMERALLKIPELKVSIRVPYVRPAQMLRLCLKPEDILSAKHDRITLEIVKEEGF